MFVEQKFEGEKKNEKKVKCFNCKCIKNIWLVHSKVLYIGRYLKYEDYEKSKKKRGKKTHKLYTTQSGPSKIFK